ncbi:MAG: alpha/beta fold hydrolase [Methylococcaceae bacterium]|nr:alpha/beta fold hydrolase [Methylococcaceae bacterium]
MKIHKEIYGTGEPIVLLHGWAMHTGIWRSFAKELAENYQVICLDLPAHGRSDNPTQFELQTISEQLIKAFPEKPCTVLGWSLGVTVSLDLAQRFPDRIKALALISGNPCFVNGENWAGMKRELLHNFADNLMTDCHTTLLRFLSLQVKGLPNYKVLVKELKAALQETAAPEQTMLQQGLDVLEQSDLRPTLATLHCPVILILGDRDTLIPVAVGQQMQILQPNLQLHILKKAGHVPFLSHTDELLELVGEFMENAHAS